MLYVYIYGEAEHSQFKYLLVDAAAAASAVASRWCDGQLCKAERVSVYDWNRFGKEGKLRLGVRETATRI